MTIGKRNGLHDKFIEAKAVGDYRQALELINELLALHPKTAEYHFEKGKLLEENFKNLKDALASYQQAAKYRAGKAVYHTYLGACLQLLGKKQEALAAIEVALKADCKYAPALIAKSIILKQEGYYEGALALANMCYSLDRELRDAILEQCDNLMRLERYQELLVKSQEVLSLNSNCFEALFYQGVALSWLGRYEESQEALDRCLEILSKQEEGRNNKTSKDIGARAKIFQGANLRLLERYEEAEELLIELARDPYKQEAAFQELVVLYIEQEEFEKAKVTLKSLEELDLNYVNINYLQGELNYRVGNYREAVKHFNFARRQGGLKKISLELIFDKQSKSYEYLEDYPRAIECHNEYQKAVAESSRTELEKLELTSDTEILISYCLMNMDEHGKAQKLVKEVLSVCPEHFLALTVEAMLLNHAGNFEKALEVADRALKEEPECSYTYYVKAIALFYLEKYEESVASFSKSFEGEVTPSRVRRHKEAMKCLEEIIRIAEDGSSLNIAAQDSKLEVDSKIKSYLTKSNNPVGKAA